jgi:hypothetical protein
MFGPRALVVVALVLGLALARRLYLQWRAGLQNERRDHPSIPRALLDGAPRTWVVFTTPYCASCGPVEERLRQSDPESRVVKVDATRQPALADAFHVRSAPTVLLADHEGTVQARLVGASAVENYISATAS